MLETVAPQTETSVETDDGPSIEQEAAEIAALEELEGEAEAAEGSDEDDDSESDGEDSPDC